MFESDDFDQILSQFDFPEASKLLTVENEKCVSPKSPEITLISNQTNIAVDTNDVIAPVRNNNVVQDSTLKCNNIVSPKHMKRKIINSYFDHKNKRKFPGPAGLLTSTLEEPCDENICHIELLSQDINFSQNNLRKDLFESPLWNRLLDDKDSWKLNNIDSIKNIKQQALNGNLRKRKAQIVTAFVEAIDRSAIDPLIILRDATGSIKCTLHRDAWSTFSYYIVSEYCALVLWKPTVLTTGSAFKKHYLNITLSNILAIYSSAVLKDETDIKTLPEGYTVVCEDDFSIIKTESPLNLEKNLCSNDETNTESDIFDGLDSIFLDDIF